MAVSRTIQLPLKTSRMYRWPALSNSVHFCSSFITVGTYHADKPLAEIERPLKSSNMRDVVSEWDANFVNIPTEELMDLIVAANFLIIPSLLDLT